MSYADPRPFPAVPGTETAPRLRIRSIGAGDQGARQTLDMMARLARESLRDPVVLERAARVVAAVGPRQRRDQAAAIRTFLLNHVRYLNDPAALELLRLPRYSLDRIAESGSVEGDCDDVALLGAALALAIGIPARFVAVGFRGPTGPLSHVWAEVQVNGQWRELDTTRPPGVRLAPPSRQLLREV